MATGKDTGSHPGDYKGKRHRQDNPQVRLSKSLSWLLRHGIEKSGLQIQPGGYLYLDEILKMPQFKKFSVEDVKHVVLTNDKKRFVMEEEETTEKLRIRATQGHTVQVEGLDASMTPILGVDDVDCVVHGTFYRFWESIKEQGLSRMKRVHIHFAGGETNIISGMRKNSEIVIYINLKQALQDGIKFYRSDNGVILSSGDQHGFILPKYFESALDKSTRVSLL